MTPCPRSPTTLSSIHPTSVDTDMIHNLDMYALLMPSMTGVALPVDAGSIADR